MKEISKVQINEVDPASLVIMHKPSIESLFGSLHPSGALFQKGFSLSKARDQVELFQEAIRSRGIELINVEDVLARMTKDELVDWASPLIEYRGLGSPQNILSEMYKKETLHAMDKSDLINMVFLNPTVTLKKAEQNTPVETVGNHVTPLYNLLFCRDQQIVTANGLVLSRMHSSQRAPETYIMKKVWVLLNVTVRSLPEDVDMYLEGGDFFPMGTDMAMIGVGLRTSMSAVQYMLDNDWFGTTRVAVVVDKDDHNQDRMHLDTVFNVIENSNEGKIVVLLDTILNNIAPHQRYVQLYEKVDGKYVLKQKVITFPDFLKDEGYTIIPVTNEEQMEYMINFLNLGGRHGILAVNRGLAEKVLPFSKIPVIYMDYPDVQAMYGSAHCTTQVFRTPLYEDGVIKELNEMKLVEVEDYRPHPWEFPKYD